MLKRIFDLTASVLLLTLLSPLLLTVLGLSYVFLGSPIFFTQIRPGKNGRPFKMFKLRTMLNTTDVDGNFLPDDQRMTNFGKFLRKSSLDELPELWNVIKGEMSLVGPRPLLMEYLPLYSKEQFRRHEVLPGITGLAQISGRNHLPWEERFLMDVHYVDHQSFILDLKILFLTAFKVLRSEGISQQGKVTMEKFKGKA